MNLFFLGNGLIYGTSEIVKFGLTFEEQDKFALQFQYLTFENQSKDSLLPPYPQLTFENQSEDLFFPSYTQLTFENQLIGAL